MGLGAHELQVTALDLDPMRQHWELSTLGHPLTDLGSGVMRWHMAPEEYDGLPIHELAALNLPTEQAFVVRCQRTARVSAPLLPFRKAFALYRFAVILKGIADRALDVVAMI
ncbi:hypothetical protein [Rubricella aquisinus]|uniref:hypothetical protein n=1 Tax=Rubricella aquisinus TaxID=2028108 RepID=UPI001608359D|nr:hypothetical protein [Rubricella aquisinus]